MVRECFFNVILPLNQVSRISSDYSDKVEFKETLFNVKKVREELDELLNLIAQLQMAIDRTNLTNQIEL